MIEEERALKMLEADYYKRKREVASQLQAVDKEIQPLLEYKNNFEQQDAHLEDLREAILLLREGIVPNQAPPLRPRNINRVRDVPQASADVEEVDSQKEYAPPPAIEDVPAPEPPGKPKGVKIDSSVITRMR